MLPCTYLHHGNVSDQSDQNIIKAYINIGKIIEKY